MWCAKFEEIPEVLEETPATLGSAEELAKALESSYLVSGEESLLGQPGKDYLVLALHLPQVAPKLQLCSRRRQHQGHHNLFRMRSQLCKFSSPSLICRSGGKNLCLCSSAAAAAAGLSFSAAASELSSNSLAL